MFTLDAKDLEKSLVKALDVVSMGSKTTAATVTLMFHKKGVTLGVLNQAGAYTSELACKVDGYKKTPPVSVIPDVLLSYIKGRKTIKVEPKSDGLALVGSGGLNAKLFYVGDGADVEPPSIDTAEGVQLHAVGLDLLKSIESMKDRTEKKPLSGRLVWDKKEGAIEILAGDTHHAAHIRREKVKCKGKGDITLPFVSLKRVLNVGGSLVKQGNTVYAISEFETLTLNDMVESEAISLEDMHKLYEGKAKAAAVLKTSELSSAIDTLSIGTEESTAINLAVDAEAKVLVASVKTGAARGTIKIKLEKATKNMKVDVLALHLVDCLKCLKSPTIKIELRENLVYMEGAASGDLIRCVIARVSQ